MNPVHVVSANTGTVAERCWSTAVFPSGVIEPHPTTMPVVDPL